MHAWQCHALDPGFFNRLDWTGLVSAQIFVADPTVQGWSRVQLRGPAGPCDLGRCTTARGPDGPCGVPCRTDSVVRSCSPLSRANDGPNLTHKASRRRYWNRHSRARSARPHAHSPLANEGIGLQCAHECAPLEVRKRSMRRRKQRRSVDAVRPVVGARVRRQPSTSWCVRPDGGELRPAGRPRAANLPSGPMYGGILGRLRRHGGRVRAKLEQVLVGLSLGPRPGAPLPARRRASRGFTYAESNWNTVPYAGCGATDPIDGSGYTQARAWMAACGPFGPR
jgi:hypothetical protein